MNVDLRHRLRCALTRCPRLVGAVVLVATALVVGDTGRTVSAAIPAGFSTQPPERLYMLPKNPIPLIPEAALGFIVPITSMLFIGPDLISMDDRELVLEFADSPPPTTCKANVDAPVGQADYDVTNCTRIDLEVFHGRLSVGPLTKVFKDDPGGVDDPAFPVFLTPSGAQVSISDDGDYNANDGIPILSLNGTELQLNNALELLRYTPDPDENDDGNTTTNDFYRYDGSNPETLDIRLVIDESVTPAPPDSTLEWDVDIRVLDINDWPELDGANDFGDGAGDGPVNQTADPGIEKIIPGGYSLTDVDNDELIDGDGSNDPDRNDGAGNDMMLIGYLDCGTEPAPASDTGFHFSSAAYESAGTTIDSALNFMLGLGNPPVPPMVPPADQAELDGYNQKLLVKSAFLTALEATPIDSTTLTSAGPVDYGTFFVGVTEIDEVQAAIENIYFKHDVEGDSCEMIVIVSDLGNNGLPLQYVSDTDFRQYGVEFPAFGFDWDQFTITTGELQEIDVSFDSTTLYVNELETATAPVHITPPPPGPPDPERPEFSFRWAAVDGTAIAGADYQGTSNNNPVVGPTDVEVLVETNAFDVDGNKTFTFELEIPSDLPPGEIDEPDGYRIVSAVPTRQVVIIDLDDAQKSINSVSGATVAEGDSGTTDLVFTIGLDGPADGNESVTVDASSVGDSVEGVDYATFDPQVVTFAPGATTATVTVEVNGDTEIELDEIVTLDLSANMNVGLTVSSADGTIGNDDAAPTVTIEQASTQSDPTNASPITFDVTFDKPVTGFDDGATDVDLTGSTAGGTLIATIAPVGSSATDYTVSVTGMTTNGDVVAVVPAGAAQDAGLRDSEASTSADNAVTWDGDPPTVTIEEGSGQADPTSTSPIVFDVVFSEPVTGFVTGDVTLASTAGTPLVGVVAGSGTTYTVSVTGMTQDGVVTATLAGGVAVDTAGNANTASTSSDNEVTFMVPPPSAINAAVADVAIAEGDTGTTNLVFTVTLTGGPAVGDETIDYATSDGTATTADNDYTPTTGTLTFADGDTDATITVPINGDYDVETNDTLTLTLSNPNGLGFADPTDANATGTITNDDDPSVVSIDDTSIAEGTTGPITVSMTNPTGHTCTVNITTTNLTAENGDYTPLTNAPLTLNGVTTNTIDLTTIADADTDTDTLSADFILNLDDNCQVGDDSATITITEPPPNDPDPLTIDVPADIVQPNDPGQAGAVVTWAAPTTTGGTPPVTVTCTPASGSFFPLGATTVTCTATDSAPPQPLVSAEPDVAAALSLSDTFTVTVVDNEAPVIDNPPDLVRFTPGNPVIVVFPLPGATDNSGVPPTVTCTPPTGSLFALGVATVVCTATDTAGNQASSSFTVTVISDGSSPPATTPTPTTPTPTGTLPETGGSPRSLLLVAAGLIVIGALLSSRRRRPA